VHVVAEECTDKDHAMGDSNTTNEHSAITDSSHSVTRVLCGHAAQPPRQENCRTAQLDAWGAGAG